MSKRTTPAKAAAAKRAAFTDQRRRLSAARRPCPPSYSVKLQIAEANRHGTLLALWGQWDWADVLLTRWALS